MNRLYRRLKVALARRDRVALASLVQDHPDAHDGCDRRASPVAMIAAAGLDLLEAAFVAGLSPDAGQKETQETFLFEHNPEHDIRNTALDCCAKHPEIAQ